MEQALIAPSLILNTHPLLSNKRSALFERPHQDETLIDYVARLKVPATSGKPAIHVNGAKIENHTAISYRLSPGDLIEVRPSAEGDFDIKTLIIVAAVALGAPALSEHLITKFGLEATSFAAKLVKAGVALGGLLVASLFAPALPQPTPRERDEQRSYSIAAARNATRLWQPFMLVLGEHRVQPDNAATPITAFAGDDQYLTQAFHFGVGKLDISDRRIGTVSVNNYDDVEVEVSDAMTGNLELYPSDVVALQGAELEHNERVVRTLPEETNEIALDFSGSLYRFDKGGIASASVAVAIDLSPSGDNQWKRLATINITNDNTKPIRATYTYPLDDSGQRDIAITKLTEDKDSAGSLGETNTIELSQVKAHQPDDADYVGQVREAIKIRATGQLSGQLDTYSALVRQIIPYYDADADAWVDAPGDWDARMQNPAAIFRAYAKGFYTPNNIRVAGMGLDDSRLDDLSEWAEFCADNELTCSYVIADASHAEVLDIIARCGRAVWDWHAGKLSVVFDDPAKIPTMLISPANIIDGSHTVEWAGSHDLAEQVVGRFLDPDNEWQHSTLRVPPNITESIERQANIELPGTTNKAQATKEVNRQWAANRLLRRRQTWQMGMEAMLLRRGDVVFMSMPRVDVAGRVVGYDDSTKTLSLSRRVEFVAAEAWLTLFDARANINSFKVEPGDAPHKIVVKDGKGRATYKGFKNSFFANGDWRVNATQFHFGDATGTLDKVKVESITWQSERQAQITAVDHLPEYYDAENDIAVVAQTKKKFQPVVITGATVHQSWHYRQGVYERLLSLAFTVGGDYRSAIVYAGTPLEQVARLDDSARASWFVPTTVRGNYPIVITPGELGLAIGKPFKLFIRLSDNDIQPSDVTRVSVEQDVAQHTVISWQEPGDEGIVGYKIRIAVGLQSVWENMSPMHTGLLTASPHETFNLPPGAYTFAIKAVNLAGNESNAAAYHTAVLNAGAPGSSVYFSNEGLRDWPGMRTNLTADSGALYTESVLGWNSLPTWENWTSFLQTPVGEAIYTTEKISLVKSLKIKALLSASVSGDSQHTIEYQADGKAWGAIPANQKITAKTLAFRIKINTNGVTPAVLSSFQIILVGA